MRPVSNMRHLRGILKKMLIKGHTFSQYGAQTYTANKLGVSRQAVSQMLQRLRAEDEYTEYEEEDIEFDEKYIG